MGDPFNAMIIPPLNLKLHMGNTTRLFFTVHNISGKLHTMVDP